MKEKKIHSNNIGIFLPNSIQYVVAYFTISLLEKVIVPIGIQAKKAEVTSTAEYCELSVIITDTQYMEILATYFEGFKFKVLIFNMDDNSFYEIGMEEFAITEEHNNCIENKTAIMLHTSGTTSNPKRVMLTQVRYLFLEIYLLWWRKYAN